MSVSVCVCVCVCVRVRVRVQGEFILSYVGKKFVVCNISKRRSRR